MRRGCYCCLTVATLLNMLTPELARGTDRFIASCQTYEGGLASASHPFPGSSFLPSASGQPRAGEANPQLGEAHGGYTSCAVLAHFLLRPLATPNDESTLDLEACLRWTAQMQALPIEGGGFRGRTNKLVDGCYSWWCGGLFPILEALLDDVGDDKEDEDAMFARIALQEYTLLAAQAPYGGLRDKPGKQQDCYHSHYNLAGLSTAQNRIIWRPAQVRAAEAGWKQGTVAKGIKSPGEDNEVAEERMKRVYAWALGWEHVKEGKIIVGDKSNQVVRLPPQICSWSVAECRLACRSKCTPASSSGPPRSKRPSTSSTDSFEHTYCSIVIMDVLQTSARSCNSFICGSATCNDTSFCIPAALSAAIATSAWVIRNRQSDALRPIDFRTRSHSVRAATFRSSSRCRRILSPLNVQVCRRRCTPSYRSFIAAPRQALNNVFAKSARRSKWPMTSKSRRRSIGLIGRCMTTST